MICTKLVVGGFNAALIRVFAAVVLAVAEETFSSFLFGLSEFVASIFADRRRKGYRSQNYLLL